jgi:hypothetical protein
MVITVNGYPFPAINESEACAQFKEKFLQAGNQECFKVLFKKRQPIWNKMAARNLILVSSFFSVSWNQV